MPSKTIPGRKRGFLEAYARCGVITEAAEIANIAREQHYSWLRDDPQYKADFEHAQQRAADSLESELFRRVREGVEEQVEDFDGKTKVTRRFSDTLLIFAMKGQKPEKYRDQWKGELTHTGMMAVSRGPDLEVLSDEQLTQLEQLALSAGSSALAHAGSGEDSGREGEESAEQDQQLLP